MRILLLFVLLFSYSYCFANQSICYGTTSKGKLSHGVSLPTSGKNFVSYHALANGLGRTYVHSEVKTIILTAYQALENNQPDKIYKYAETGFKNGGKFKPHKTHQNGLSVDFMVPVINKKGQSVHLPTHMGNKFGYNINFNHNSQYKHYTIDYEALAAHIVALHQAAKKNGYDLWRVIFDPKLQPNLFKTKYADYLKKHIQFSTKPSWVRHDEHYHVDFEIPCNTL